MSDPQQSKSPQPPGARVINAPPRKQAKPPGPSTMVIFGAGGDLTKRLLVPALYNLCRTRLLPAEFSVVGVDIADLAVESWRDELRKMMQTFVGDPSSEAHLNTIDADAWQRLTAGFSYLQGDLNDPRTFERLRDHLHETGHAGEGRENVLFYLAIADRFFAPTIEGLAHAGLLDEQRHDGIPRRWRRVVIEKPFGHDLQSAKDLNARLLRVMQESQIYRIDHFLGKETVQNIMALRFANGIFEPLWNRDRIDHVQITVSETVGVEHRGRFYERTGALRDMVPNHVFQLLAMVGMEPPAGFDARSIRDRKADLFAALRSVTEADAVRGQYGPGTVRGQTVRGYREEPDVAPDSNTETFVAMRLAIDNWRWAGVPFYLRTGKHMSQRLTEIAVRFRPAPYAPFEATEVSTLGPNWMILHIQPEEGVSLQFDVKRPGPVVDLASVRMDFHYRDYFPPEANVGYETLIYDVMTGDPTLFQRADMIEETWRVVQPVLDAWGATPPRHFPNYASGSDGPAAADALLRDDGRAWRS